MGLFKRGLSVEAIKRIKEAVAPDYDPEMETQLFGDYQPLFSEQAVPQAAPTTELNPNDRLTQLFNEVYSQMPDDAQGALSIALDLFQSEGE